MHLLFALTGLLVLGLYLHNHVAVLEAVLAVSWPGYAMPDTAAPEANADDGNSIFTLRNVYHRNTDGSRQHGRLDVRPEVMTASSAHVLNSKTHRIRRWRDRSPRVVESYLKAAWTGKTGRKQDGFASTAFDWVDDHVEVPNVHDKATIVSLAEMSNNAYADEPYTADDWNNMTDPSWTPSSGIGWMSDGLRGYVFVDPSNSTVVIALKGTSASVFYGGGDTVTNDKVNDNLLFSCCCARISYLWNTVCDCYTGDSFTCDNNCLESELYSRDHYYHAALDVYRNVTALYPNSNVWVTGHSLGGAVSALLARTYGLPAITFEAPGEALTAKRLHLPMAPGIPVWQDHIWHVGHNADPIFMGICNGAGSTCWIGGYAMETKCHTGMTCTYDAVNDLGWHVSMVNHRIRDVIDGIIYPYNATAVCVVPEPCQDCFNWDFQDGGASSSASASASTITSTSITTTTTRTTLVTSTTSSTTSTTSRKCVGWSWFGRCTEYEDPVVTETPK